MINPQLFNSQQSMSLIYTVRELATVDDYEKFLLIKEYIGNVHTTVCKQVIFDIGYDNYFESFFYDGLGIYGYGVPEHILGEIHLTLPELHGTLNHIGFSVRKFMEEVINSWMIHVGRYGGKLEFNHHFIGSDSVVLTARSFIR